MKTTFRKLTVAWPLVTFLLLPALTRAETAVQAWVQRYHGPGNGWDEAYAVAVDGSNNVIVTGKSYVSGGDYDWATIKYSSAGVPLWTNRYSGPGYSYDGASAVAVDGSNNVIVTGCSAGTLGGVNYTTIKYSTAGLALWTNCYNGPGYGDDLVTAVVVDHSNNVIVTGYSYASVMNGDCDYATIKYSSAGVPLRTDRYTGPGSNYDEARAVAVDGNNDVVVTGVSYTSQSSADYATIKYSSAGLSLWANRYHGPANYVDIAVAAVVDGSNDVIVAGYSYGAGTNYDYATIKYSGAGVPLWTNLYNGPGNGDDEASALAVDGNNDVIVTGYSYGSGNFYQYATIKYSSTGVPLWTNRYNGSGNSAGSACAVSVDGGNNVVVTGCSVGSGGYCDYATIKYSSAGVPLWTTCYTGPGNGDNFARAMAVDRSGNVIVAGVSAGSGTHYDFATVKYICVPEPVMTGFQLTNGTFQLRVDDVLQPGTLVIEAGTNLSTTNWAPVFTNTTPTNVLFYADPEAGNTPARFYRAFQFP